MLFKCLARSSLLKIYRTSISFDCRRYSKRILTSGPRKTHYEILGLNQNATASDIRAAFVTLSKEIHPDKNPDDPENHSKFVQLNEAYTILSKPQSRREYDVSLAHWLHVQQTMARAGYTTHSAGDAQTPGFSQRHASYGGNGQQRAFWDETIWYMRDHSKDANAFYEADSYYGIKGIPRQSNATIVILCLVLIAFGFVYFYIGFRYTARKQRERLENIDRKNLRILKETQERARLNGIAKQLEIFNAKYSAQKNSPGPSD